ncbi:molecular chaperone TorD [uncultured Shewanella sp.]|uniref:molecular chaperone TorD n=1 Tax=uncultured Shewanella sp. TaxID=173975 RepID=UPI00262669BC|nr:molecular chaperone TorD [uncultured Shewanella sp.]
MNKNEINNAITNQARAMVYRFLSSLFAKEINRQHLKELLSEQAQAFLAQLATEPKFQHDVNILVSTLQTLDTHEAQLTLAADYCGLFLLGTKQSASPYASLYLDKAKQEQDDVPLFGQQHQQMLQFLKQAQLQVQTHFPEPADHLAVILAYCEHLCINQDIQAQFAFIDSYLNTWLQQFVTRVIKYDQGQFYSALARLTQSWILYDLKTIKPHL